MTPGSALVLFDIDGTLIRRAGPHHRDALVSAVLRVTGVPTSLDGIPVQGMLDRDIITCMLRNAGVGTFVIRRAMPEIVRLAQVIYGRGCPDLRKRVCPGVRPLLGSLARYSVPAGLVTGNLSTIGWKKMQYAGLKRFFGFGAFAEMAATRAGLAGIAIGHARTAGWVQPHTQITLIGDHPNDVQAAKLNGVRSIAVCTGIATAKELRACSPDLLLPDLRSLHLDMLI